MKSPRRLLIPLLMLPLTAMAAPPAPTPPAAAAEGPRMEMVGEGVEYKPYELTPFVGTYQVFRGGNPLGNATMRLVNTGGARWRIDLSILGTRGLAGMAGLNIQQSTVFEATGDQYRPLTQSTVMNALLANRKTVGTYDWARRSASWTGDVRKSRRGQAIALQNGDMSGLLINLALMRDARPGAQLSYRFVDDSRLRTYQYRVADATENLTVGDIAYNALRVERTNGGNDESRLWVTQMVPLPVRIYMKDNDGEPLDLLLVNYKGG